MDNSDCELKRREYQRQESSPSDAFDFYDLFWFSNPYKCHR